jgi:hypothetical protein
MNLVLPRNSASESQLNDAINPSQLNQQIAQSVYGGIGHE